jgi:hypothetical protein
MVPGITKLFARARRRVCKDMTEKEDRNRTCITILFALKICAPEAFPNDISQSEMDDVLELNPELYGWKEGKGKPGINEIMLRSMVAIIRSPRVSVDKQGLHVARLGTRKIVHQEEFPPQRYI